jgi:3-oxoacyl-[acyl-carrier protein] reductase
MQTLLTKSIHKKALQGRKALVFGASSGLGFASAKTLASLGADVVMLARNAEKLEAAAERLRAVSTGKVLTEAQDITDVAGLQQVLDKHLDTDILITNCGGPAVAPFESMDLEQWEQAWQGQLRSAIQACRTLVPAMAKRGNGRVIMIASVTVVHPMQGFALSNSIRPGLQGLAATLTQEYAKQGITANLICPGITGTERIEKLVQNSVDEGKNREEVLAEWSQNLPVKRMGDAEEIGAMAGFLASDVAGFISGQTLVLDGGQSVAG